MSNVINKLRTMILKLNLGRNRFNFVIHLGENDCYALAMYLYQKEYGVVDIEEDDECLEEYIANKQYESLKTFKGIKVKWSFRGETSIENIKETEAELTGLGDNTMNFQNAVEAMKLGSKVRRLCWPENIIHIEAVETIIESLKGRKDIFYTFGTKENNAANPWSPTLKDLEANDWWIVV